MAVERGSSKAITAADLYDEEDDHVIG
jgi:hypothetical protein